MIGLDSLITSIKQNSIDFSVFSQSDSKTQAELQVRYSAHRITRNAQQKEKLLSSEFSGLILDPILQRLEDPSIQPGYQDPRYCVVFWARPPAHIRSLVNQIQQQLLSLAPRMLPISH